MFASSSDWPLCADGTGYTLELINTELDNSVAENWDCLNEFGSPNAHNNENLSVVSSTDFNQVKIYPNPVNAFCTLMDNHKNTILKFIL